MNESIGGSLLLSLVVIVVGLMIAIFTASFAYTKAYRAKSIIIKTIEDHNGFDVNDNIVTEIDNQLTNTGYRKDNQICSYIENKTLVWPKDNQTQSSYCIYKITESDEKGNESVFYEVHTYMFFDVPLVNFKLPVKGQTSSFREKMINVVDEEEI